ncbi:hypothetical protein RHMOL_Rhmol10G0268800 [Rhododendron molle]|uniref:Uncharacterized protein n=1 Tax=Rhododendron molle TaxID=49168 RepID=A0ACC0M7P0_RHOML|nr:hypothetical protein RHMOL_Rhmol10G0268800 [Rhododendron molle]
MLRIALGCIELHLAATNYSWPHRIALGCIELLYGLAILRGQMQCNAANSNSL